MSNTDEEMAALYKGRAEGKEYLQVDLIKKAFSLSPEEVHQPVGCDDFSQYGEYIEIQRPETLEEGWERLTKGCNYSLREWSFLEEGFHIGAKWAVENNSKGDAA